MNDTVTRRAVLRRVCGGASVEISGQSLAEKIMNFEFLPGSRRHRRQNHSLQAPAMLESLESLESRVVLSAAPVVSLPGVPVGSSGMLETSDSTPQIAFTEVPGATGYEIWVSDVEARQRILLDETISASAREYTPTTEFQLGANRIWMRALFGSGAPGPYSSPVTVLLKTVPSVTGPQASVAGVPRKVDGNEFPITWTDSKGARSYEIFLSNQTTLTSTVYRVQNRTEVLNALGQAIPDGNGGVLLQETRQFFTSGAVTLPPQVPRSISGASNTADIEIMLPNHGLKTGEQVRINGVEGNTAANGTFFVTVTSDNTFLLKGVSGTGNWTGGGNVVQVTQLRSELEMGSYRVFMRSVDDSVPGRVSAWSPAYEFEVAPAVKLLRPTGQTFETPITVEWEGVPEATHYELIVKPRGAADSAAIVNVPYLKATSYQLPTSQLSTIAFTGSPTGGSYRLSFRYPGANGRTDTTGLLPFNATANDIRAAVARLGFQNVSVRATTSGANPVYELTLGRVPGPIGVSAVSQLTPGSVSVTTQQIATDYGDMEFRVRARRLTQVSDVTISGTPTSGTFSLTFATPGPKGTTVTTAPMPISATAAEVQTQIQLLEGYSRATVTSRGTAPNVTYSIVLPQLSGQITVTVASDVTPGTVQNSGNRYSPEVTGIAGPPAYFSTNSRPVVTPLPGAQVYTAEKPTLTWSAVDRAATYRIWVDRSAAQSVYLQTESPSNSFTFAEKLPAGNYFFWVQSVSNTGELSKWSEPYQFTATGGAPVILTPLNNSSTINPLPLITWAPVAEAVTYNVHVALIGGPFNFITASGLTTNRFIPVNPLNAATYRVWIQAVTSDGRKLAWSAPVTFNVV